MPIQKMPVRLPHQYTFLGIGIKGPPVPGCMNVILKMAILHRKNSYFYKTENGTWVGDLFMSLINTCRLEGINPFEYLTALQRNAERVRANPAQWLPWNYEATLAGLLVRAAVG